MLPDKKIKCPYTGFKTSCFVGVTKHNCPKWVRVSGTDKNTGAPVDLYDCSDAWIPGLLIENSQVQRETGAAVESFRNVVMTERIYDRLADHSQETKLIELNS